MADEMNGTEAARHIDGIQAALSERVTNLNRRQTDMEAEMRSGFKQMESSLGNFANETRNSIQQLAASIAERSRPQWQAIGVTISFCAIAGAVLYYPINMSVSDLKSAVSTLAERVVSRQEMEWRQSRGLEDRQRIENALAQLREEQVPRKELERVWDAGAQRDTELQRQIDQLTAQYNGTYGARDVILDLRERIDRLERNPRSP